MAFLKRPFFADVRTSLPRHAIRLQVLGTFSLLVLVTVLLVGLSLYLFKKNTRDSYYSNLDQRLVIVENVLTGIAGETALQNSRPTAGPTFTPYLLNVSALDVQNPRKAFDIAAQSGCLIKYQEVAELCAALGNQGSVGAYLYIVGWMDGGDILPHVPGSSINDAHHLQVDTSVRGQDRTWIVTFQGPSRAAVSAAVPNPLDVDLYATGYRKEATGNLSNSGRNEKEFRGRLHYSTAGSRCADSDCKKRWQFVFRVPLDEFREESLVPEAPWPPRDYHELQVRMRIFAPPQDSADPRLLLDSSSSFATKKFAFDSEVGRRFLPLERLFITRADRPDEVLWASGEQSSNEKSSAWGAFVRWTLALIPGRLAATEKGFQRRILGKFGAYDLYVVPSEEIAYRSLENVASQYIVVLAAMIVLLSIAWLFVERRVVHRIGQLTVRAEELPDRLRSGTQTIHSDFDALQGRDELGVLAQGIHELLSRVNDDLKERRQRLEQNREMWEAIGHEILSPLQSLLTLHPEGMDDDLSRPYLARMERAVRTLQGSTSIETADWPVSSREFDIEEYLSELCENAPLAGRSPIEYAGIGQRCLVRCDDTLLETAISHVLDNASRFNPHGSPMRLRLSVDQEAARAVIRIANNGRCIPVDQLETIFHLGVTETAPQGDLFTAHRGQGLFVARRVMSSMGGTIEAANLEPSGVEFILRLPLS